MPEVASKVETPTRDMAAGFIVFACCGFFKGSAKTFKSLTLESISSSSFSKFDVVDCLPRGELPLLAHFIAPTIPNPVPLK